MKRVLLMNMPSSIELYKKSKLKAAIAPRPFLSLAMLAANVLETGNDAKILDLQLSTQPIKDTVNMINNYNPDFVGLTFTTPLYSEAKRLSNFIRKNFPKIKIISGGVHTSIVPEQVLKETDIDIAAYGEGDITIREIVTGKPLKIIRGIFYKDEKGKIHKNLPRPLVENLDSLPFPAWHLFPVDKYKNPKMMARKNPVGTIETSRGCLFSCTYCNKKIFGRCFRKKSVKRVADEFEHLKKSGFNEVHVWDDMFSTDLQRGKDICDEMIRRKINIPWQLDCGVRVNSVDQEFFHKLKKAGCYKVAFGFESGNQKILNRIKKGILLQQSMNAIRMAKEAGLETIGFFMLGLPDETLETMNDTIDFAIKLDPDYAKTTLLVPFPGTEIYNEWKEKGVIKSEDWSKYNDHSPSKVYNHPNLDWKTLERYYNLFYKKFYIRPKYIAKRFLRSLVKGELLYDFYYAIKTFT